MANNPLSNRTGKNAEKLNLRKRERIQNRRKITVRANNRHGNMYMNTQERS